MVSDNKTASRRETGDAVPKGTRNLDNSIVVADTMKGKIMGMNADFHMNGVPQIRTGLSTGVAPMRYAVVTLDTGRGELRIFADTVEQLDRLASVFESLAREVRDAGWPIETK